MAIYRGDTKVSGVGKGFSPENSGTEGQVLTKTATGYAYQDVEALPDGGEVGNKLAKTATGSEWVDGELVEITEGGFDYPAMRGPCDEGFHVPTNDEWNKIRSILNDKDIRIYLKMPLAGFHNWTGSGWSSQGTKASYFSCTVNESTNKPGGIYSTGTYTVFERKQKDMLSSIRPFKDTPVIPNNTWTVLDGTLGSAGIFWNSTLGIISLTSDGTDYITIADKNSGATTVYNNGDNLTNNNCGYQYQRGNNYGVYYGTTLTTSSTRVDASSYGPGNYYSSSTIILPRDTTNFDWSSVRNDNLRGGVTGVILGGKYVGEDRINEVPSIGAVGQVLTKQSNGYGFENLPLILTTSQQQSLKNFLSGNGTILIDKEYSIPSSSGYIGSSWTVQMNYNIYVYQIIYDGVWIRDQILILRHQTSTNKYYEKYVTIYDNGVTNNMVRFRYNIQAPGSYIFSGGGYCRVANSTFAGVKIKERLIGY